MVPNADGVNNGEWLTWYDNRLAVPTYVTGRSTTSTFGYAPVYSSGLTWPYAWNIGSGDNVGLSFKLNQFGAKHPRLAFKSKRSGIISGVDNYLIGVWNGSSYIAWCGGPGSGALVSYSWESQDCFVPSPYNSQLNYSGGLNGMYLSITGDGFGGAIDLLDVNYVYLSIEP